MNHSYTFTDNERQFIINSLTHSESAVVQSLKYTNNEDRRNELKAMLDYVQSMIRKLEEG